MIRSFQDCRLYPELTVYDVLMLCEDAKREVSVLSTTLQLPWARRAEREKRVAVDQVIDAFGLGRFHDHRTAELSTGTRRVVDLASIVLANPRLLLLDEPTAGIAQREAEAFIPLLQRIHQVADTTIVLVEHDVPLVFSLCSAVVVMELGRVAVAGPPEEVRARPEGTHGLPWCERRGDHGIGAGPPGERRARGRVREKGNMDSRTLHVNPVAPLGRSWRRLRRRPVAMQVRTILLILAVIVGLVLWIDLAPSSDGERGPPAWQRWPPSRPRSRRPARARGGVTANSINVVFPIVNLNSEAGKLGFAEDAEYGEQSKAINFYVDQINNAGGIHGRKINPIIVQFDPQDEAGMQALCKDWTEGSPAAFAVVDGLGGGAGTTSSASPSRGRPR